MNLNIIYILVVQLVFINFQVCPKLVVICFAMREIFQLANVF